jgi:hypothetical protein
MGLSWQEVRGDETHALDWDLNEDSEVLEIGGFEGRWVQQIWDKFHCNITVYEPQLWAVERMRKRFSETSKVEIRPYGLWVTSCEMSMGGFETDGCSTLKDGAEIGFFKSAMFELEEFSFFDVALMNIEGAEYELIPHLVSTVQISMFRNFWCQFHPGLVENSNALNHEIYNGLAETHDLLWDFFPTAVAWRKR